ncbi:MAG TPA: hypothetical protein VIX89_10090 [Bryobacteraceae bacterium]
MPDTQLLTTIENATAPNAPRPRKRRFEPPPAEPELDASILGEEYTTEPVLLRSLGFGRRKWLQLLADGRGPRRTVLGRTVYYRKDTIASWMESLEQRRSRTLLKLAHQKGMKKARKEASHG